MVLNFTQTLRCGGILQWGRVRRAVVDGGALQARWVQCALSVPNSCLARMLPIADAVPAETAMGSATIDVLHMLAHLFCPALYNSTALVQSCWTGRGLDAITASLLPLPSWKHVGGAPSRSHCLSDVQHSRSARAHHRCWW